jgi:hypothetical protein
MTEILDSSSGWKTLSTMKIEVAGSFETFVIPSAGRNFQEDRNLESHCCENSGCDSTFWLREETIWESERDYSLPEGLISSRSIVEQFVSWKPCGRNSGTICFEAAPTYN